MISHNKIIPRRRWTFKVFRIIIVLLLIIAVCFVIFRLCLRSKLQSKLDAIRAAGYPVTCAELDKWYCIPESSENAADTMMEAFSRYDKWNEESLAGLPVVGEAELPAPAEILPEEMAALITKYLADNEKAIDLLIEGAAIEHGRYPLDPSQYFDDCMPALKEVRHGAKLLQLKSILHAENNEPQLAIDSVTAIFGVGHSLANGPTIISWLIRTGCYDCAVSALERIVNRTELTDEQLTRVSAILANAYDGEGLLRGFAGERCIITNVLKDPFSHSSGGSRSRAPSIIYRVTGWTDAETLLYIYFMTKYMEVMQLEPHLRQEAAKAIDAEFISGPGIYMFVSFFVSPSPCFITFDLKNMARLRIARAALAVERYRLATGNIPDTLGELVPAYLDAVAKDPFDGKDLRYKKLDTGFVVYSIDKDGQDDGGKKRAPTETSVIDDNTYDISFVVEY